VIATDKGKHQCDLTYGCYIMAGIDGQWTTMLRLRPATPAWTNPHDATPLEPCTSGIRQLHPCWGNLFQGRKDSVVQLLNGAIVANDYVDEVGR
jgi:hypothetical protein